MNSLYDFFGEIVEKKLGNKDATFNDVSVSGFVREHVSLSFFKIILL